MAIFHLHIRSRIHLDHVEDDLDVLEQRFLPDSHYVLSREGPIANYLIETDQEPAEFYNFVLSHCDGLLLDQLSLVEVGRSFASSEHGCNGRPSTDFCGEWSRRQNDESFEWEEVRVRTGVQKWFGRHLHGRNERDMSEALGLFLYLNQDLPDSSRWLDRLRDALGSSSRPHMRDRRAVLITWASKQNPSQVLKSAKIRRYLDERVHTSICFTLGKREKHTAGDLQSVRPMQGQRAPARPQPTTAQPAPSLVKVGTYRPYSKNLGPALEALRRAHRDRLR